MPTEISVSKALAEGVPIHPSQDMRRLPIRMHSLTMVERNGYYWVCPWFVGKANDGTIDFRAADGRKWQRAVRESLCWVCGHKLGVHLTFVLGPMCTITRTTAEPPCHLECARWSALNCPFLANPEMIRRPAPMPQGAVDAPGMGIARNPGVTGLWITRSFTLFSDDHGRSLIRVGQPEEVEWWARGRQATLKEVEASIESGYPILRKVAAQQGDDALQELAAQRRAAAGYLPAA